MNCPNYFLNPGLLSETKKQKERNQLLRCNKKSIIFKCHLTSLMMIWIMSKIHFTLTEADVVDDDMLVEDSIDVFMEGSIQKLFLFPERVNCRHVWRPFQDSVQNVLQRSLADCDRRRCTYPCVKLGTNSKTTNPSCSSSTFRTLTRDSNTIFQKAWPTAYTDPATQNKDANMAAQE